MTELKALIEPRTYWDEAEGMFVVPLGACPYPIDGRWTVEQCQAAGNCGCDAQILRSKSAET